MKYAAIGLISRDIDLKNKSDNDKKFLLTSRVRFGTSTRRFLRF